MATRRPYGDAVLAGAILLILAVMIVPIPTFLLDLLLVLDIGLALVVLLMTVYTQQPLRFNVFPTLLLLSTLYRLALNVASTRTILLQAYGGKVIEAFGNFVVGGNYAVGIVAFTILAVIQFVVITKGASRIAEVAARFTLDAMPGRQMAIEQGAVGIKHTSEGDELIAPFVAVWRLVDGRWSVASLRELPADNGPRTPHDHLQELAWMVGDWMDEADDSLVTSSCRWSQDGNFLIQEFTVQSAGAPAVTGSQRIGIAIPLITLFLVGMVFLRWVKPLGER